MALDTDLAVGVALQEQGRGDGAGVAAADVADVGDGLLDVVLVLLHQRQLPQLV